MPSFLLEEVLTVAYVVAMFLLATGTVRITKKILSGAGIVGEMVGIAAKSVVGSALAFTGIAGAAVGASGGAAGMGSLLAKTGLEKTALGTALNVGAKGGELVSAALANAKPAEAAQPKLPEMMPKAAERSAGTVDSRTTEAAIGNARPQMPSAVAPGVATPKKTPDVVPPATAPATAETSPSGTRPTTKSESAPALRVALPGETHVPAPSPGKSSTETTPRVLEPGSGSAAGKVGATTPAVPITAQAPSASGGSAGTPAGGTPERQPDARANLAAGKERGLSDVATTLETNAEAALRNAEPAKDPATRSESGSVESEERERAEIATAQSNSAKLSDRTVDTQTSVKGESKDRQSREELLASAISNARPADARPAYGAPDAPVSGLDGAPTKGSPVAAQTIRGSEAAESSRSSDPPTIATVMGATGPLRTSEPPVNPTGAPGSGTWEKVADATGSARPMESAARASGDAHRPHQEPALRGETPRIAMQPPQAIPAVHTSVEMGEGGDTTQNILVAAGNAQPATPLVVPVSGTSNVITPGVSVHISGAHAQAMAHAQSATGGAPAPVVSVSTTVAGGTTPRESSSANPVVVAPPASAQRQPELSAAGRNPVATGVPPAPGPGADEEAADQKKVAETLAARPIRPATADDTQLPEAVAEASGELARETLTRKTLRSLPVTPGNVRQAAPASSQSKPPQRSAQRQA